MKVALLLMLATSACLGLSSGCEQQRGQRVVPSGSASGLVQSSSPSGSASSPRARFEPPPPSDVVCKGAAATAIPEQDLPSVAARATLRGCDGEALYYGIGVPVDYERARLCALVVGQQDGASVIGGPEMLMMVYANGRGVKANYDLALRFACQVGGAPVELDSRLSRLWDARQRGSLDREMDICDDITSGYMSGYCAAHRERIAAVPRNARRRLAVSGLPPAELAALDKAAARYFRTRSDNEVDLTGSMRAVFGIQEQARLEDDLVSALERLREPKFPGESSPAARLDREIGSILAHIASCKGFIQMERIGLAGTVTRAGIRQTQAAWLSYRSAFIALALKVRPESKPETWRAWLDQQRLVQLQELARGC